MSPFLPGVLAVLELRHEQKQVIEFYVLALNKHAREAGLGVRYVERRMTLPEGALRKYWKEVDRHLVAIQYTRDDPTRAQFHLNKAFDEIITAESILKTFIAEECNLLLRRAERETERALRTQSRSLFKDARDAQTRLAALKTSGSSSVDDLTQADLTTGEGASQMIKYVASHIERLKDIEKAVKPTTMATRALVIGTILAGLVGLITLILQLSGVI